jgi:hypothetical protein
MKYSSNLLFISHVFFSLAAIGLSTAILVAAELRVTRGPLLAELEIANTETLLAQETRQ